MSTQTLPGSPHAERRRAVLLVFLVWAVGFGLAAVLVCPAERKRPVVGAASPCILLTVDPQGARADVTTRVDACPGDCTPAGAYCIRIVEARP
jgi:hypothetical protein